MLELGARFSAARSMLMRNLQPLRLRRRGLFLILRLPLLIRHAVDTLACLRIRHGDALLLRFLAIPAREAVAAEAGEIHEIDVLHIGALAQMLDQAAERRR